MAQPSLTYAVCHFHPPTKIYFYNAPDPSRIYHSPLARLTSSSRSNFLPRARSPATIWY